jgi:hypothetical protein
MSGEKRKERWGRAFNAQGEERLIGPEESFTKKRGKWVNDNTGKLATIKLANDLDHITQLHDDIVLQRTGDEVYN